MRTLSPTDRDIPVARSKDRATPSIKAQAIPKILVVDDTESTRETIAEVLELLPAEVYTAPEIGAALKIMGRTRLDAIVSDFRMPGASGLDLLKLVRKIAPFTEFVLLTGFANVQDAVEAMKNGAADYLQKPINTQELLAVVRRAVEHGRMRREVEDLRRRVREKGSFNNILTCSDQLRSILQVVQDVAYTDATLLITGESGTGKELIARAVVENSQRSGGPFYTVNCAALTESLVESELFGHVRGAFTGATTDRRGILGEADGGTVFLDEVGELPPATQAKLLRFLETGEIQRVGSAEIQRVDVRVVAATNRNLKEDVERGRFREDLYFRLNVISIETPPLRERPEDIILLAEHFIEEMNARHNCRVEGLSKNAKEVLLNYKWPGNVRELRNWIERMVIIKGTGTLEVDDLHGGNREIFDATANQNIRWPEMTLDELDNEYIRYVLKKARGNRTAAAEKLGISRVTLWRKLKEMGIE
jgi:DNA-binding NtrC family response regulator